MCTFSSWVRTCLPLAVAVQAAVPAPAWLLPQISATSAAATISRRSLGRIGSDLTRCPVLSRTTPAPGGGPDNPHRAQAQPLQSRGLARSHARRGEACQDQQQCGRGGPDAGVSPVETAARGDGGEGRNGLADDQRYRLVGRRIGGRLHHRHGLDVQNREVVVEQKTRGGGTERALWGN